MRRYQLLTPLVLWLTACEADCMEAPGIVEPIEGCEVDLYEGEDVFGFCVHPADSACGDAESPEAHGWLVTLQNAPTNARPRPLRVACGPIDPALLPRAGAKAQPDDCCWLMVYDEAHDAVREENKSSCIETHL